MDETYDGYLRLVQIVLLKQFTEDIQTKDGLHIGLHSLVPAFNQIGHKIQVFHEVEPGRSVFLLADFVVVYEVALL